MATSKNDLNAMAKPAVIPHLVCAGAAEAIEFYKKAFGAEEKMRLDGQDGKIMHACIAIGGSPIFLADECRESLGPKALKGSPVVIHLNVADADAFAARAEKAGAKLIMPVTEMFWGDRYGQVEDPFGHVWSVATHVRDVSVADLQAAAQKMGNCGDAA